MAQLDQRMLQLMDELRSSLKACMTISEVSALYMLLVDNAIENIVEDTVEALSMNKTCVHPQYYRKILYGFDGLSKPYVSGLEDEDQMIDDSSGSEFVLFTFDPEGHSEGPKGTYYCVNCSTGAVTPITADIYMAGTGLTFPNAYIKINHMGMITFKS